MTFVSLFHEFVDLNTTTENLNKSSEQKTMTDIHVGPTVIKRTFSLVSDKRENENQSSMMIQGSIGADSKESNDSHLGENVSNTSNVNTEKAGNSLSRDNIF